ncbi:hypothetical protein KF728_02505 [Candidatus Obscuribacterales bacterium]|nr:hypothetical protein [Candidatus Obscuribacterales bacterium]
MSPRAFQTILVASMGSKDRLELESKVLAAALKQSHARGDTSGVSLAHKQIFLLLRQQQAAERAASADTGDQTENRPSPPPEPAAPPKYTSVGTESVTDVNAVIEPSGLHEKPKKMKKRVMPDIVWGDDASSDETVESSAVEGSPHDNPAAAEVQSPAVSSQAAEPEAPPAADVQQEAHSDDSGLADSGDFVSHVPGENLAVEGDKAAFDAYGILQVEQIASFEEIHRSFLFLVRRVLMGLKKAKKKQRRPLLDELQNLWIAHDILSDPVTRTDFDFRILGLRGAPDVIIHSAPEDKVDSISSRTPLRIGELMQCAGLLEPTELEIAADMHRAMPEMLFGAFLVKQGFISEEDLQQVLMGQRLLKNGNLTVGHYQMCMKLWRESQTPIENTAVAEGFVTQSEMERIVAAGLRDTAGVPAYEGGAGANRGAAARINTEEAAKRVFRAERAVPQWKDQLDWSEPEAIEEYVAEDREQEQIRKPIRNNLDIEGVTDNQAKDPGKKSLRRLMEGIHSPDQPNIEDGGPAGVSLKSILSSGDTPMQGQVRVDRLAASVPADEAVDTAPSLPDAPQVKPGRPNIDFTIGGSDDDTAGGDTPVPYADSSIVETQALETQGLQMRTSDAMTAREAVTEMFAEAGDREGSPDSVSDETTSEELAVDSRSALYAAEHPTARPTTEVPLPRVVMEEKTQRTSGEDDENVFGEVDYDDEDDADGEIDLGFIPEEGAPAADVKVERPDGEPVMQPAAESEPSSVSMDDLLDFSTPIADSEAAEAAKRGAEGADRSGIKTVLDEAFNGVKVPELPPQAPAPEEILARRAEAEANFEAIAEEESQMQSGVYPIANLDDHVAAGDTDTVRKANSVAAQVPTLPTSEPSTSSATGVNLSSNLLQSLDATISVNESSFKAVNEHAKKEQMKQHVGEEGFVIPRGIERVPLDPEVEKAPQVTSSQAPEVSQEMTMDLHKPLETYATSESSKATVSMEVSPVSVSENEPVEPGSSVKPFGSLNRKSASEPLHDESAEAHDDETSAAPPSEEETAQTGNSAEETGRGVSAVESQNIAESNESVGKTSAETADVDQQEDPQDSLKSGEWQIVYKLQGSLADMFMSEEAEPDMQRMRPRLTEIDSIIPSSIAKMTKDDTDDKADESTESEDDAESENQNATKSGDKKQSDKPVIKPVSNNYYRNDKTGNKSDDKAD